MKSGLVSFPWVLAFAASACADASGGASPSSADEAREAVEVYVINHSGVAITVVDDDVAKGTIEPLQAAWVEVSVCGETACSDLEVQGLRAGSQRVPAPPYPIALATWVGEPEPGGTVASGYADLATMERPTADTSPLWFEGQLTFGVERGDTFVPLPDVIAIGAAERIVLRGEDGTLHALEVEHPTTPGRSYFALDGLDPARRSILLCDLAVDDVAPRCRDVAVAASGR